jgi:hypothetical protein
MTSVGSLMPMPAQGGGITRFRGISALPARDDTALLDQAFQPTGPLQANGGWEPREIRGLDPALARALFVRDLGRGRGQAATRRDQERRQNQSSYEQWRHRQESGAYGYGFLDPESDMARDIERAKPSEDTRYMLEAILREAVLAQWDNRARGLKAGQFDRPAR